MHGFHMLAGLIVAAFGAVSLTLPLAAVHRLDRHFRGFFDGHFGDGAFVMLHRVLSIVVIIFGIALVMNVRGSV